MRRTVLAVLLVGCAAALFAGGATEAPEAAAPGQEALVSAQKITLRVMVPMYNQGCPWEDMEVIKTLEELTNVHMEFDQALEGFEEKKNLALASGDLPDIFLNSLSANDEEVYGPQGYFQPLGDLIDKYAPEIKAAFAKYPILKRVATARDGKIYALPQYSVAPTNGEFKPVVNTTWLKNLGLKIPETTDDLYKVLVAFRDKDPNQNGTADEIPLGSRASATPYPNAQLTGFLLPAFGQLKNLWVDKGKVEYSPRTDGYKAYLQFANKLYNEKLLENRFLSQSWDEMRAKLSKSMYGVMAAANGCDHTQYQIISPLTSSIGSERMANSVVEDYTEGRYAITKVNKYPVESIKWANLLFHQAGVSDVQGITGQALCRGRLGVEWEFTEDKTAIRYLIQPDPGESVAQTINKRIAPTWGDSPGLDVTYVPIEGTGYMTWMGNGNVKYIFPYVKAERFYPSVRHTKEELDRVAIIETDLQSYVGEMFAKYVVGEASFDTWGDYLQTLQKLKVDEYLKIKQTAYDRFAR